MKKVKVFFSVLLSIILFSSVYVYAENITKMIQVTYRNISIQVNGKQIQSDKEPFIYQGSVFAPIRTIGEAVNKKIEWNDKANQVNITDKESNFLSFPLHKIGEKVEIFPLAITVKKAYKVTYENSGDKQHYFQIDLTLENISDDSLEILQESRSFTLWDKNGNKLRDLFGRNFSLHMIPKGKSSEKGYVFCKFDEKLKNKHLVFVFYPKVENYSDIANFNIFLAIDIGKIE